jgi:hypothetical protein
MIDHYRFGRIIIDGITYGSDVLVYPERVDDRWWRQESHRLSLEDVQKVVRAHPRIFVVGTGYFGRMKIDPAVSETLKREGISLVAERTAKACKLYNQLRDTGMIVAAMHLTC